VVGENDSKMELIFAPTTRHWQRDTYWHWRYFGL